MLLRNTASTGRSFLVGLAALVVAAAVTGCGGSGEAQPLTKSQFVLQANEICQGAAEEQKQGGEEITADDQLDQSEGEEAVVEHLVAPVGAMAEELGDLGPPEGDQQQVAAIVRAFEAGVAKLEADPLAKNAASAFANADELAAAHGLTDCSI
jgi:hypothetical protein